MSEEFIDETRTGVTESPEVDSIWLTNPSVKPVIIAACTMPGTLS